MALCVTFLDNLTCKVSKISIWSIYPFGVPIATGCRIDGSIWLVVHPSFFHDCRAIFATTPVLYLIVDDERDTLLNVLCPEERSMKLMSNPMHSTSEK